MSGWVRAAAWGLVSGFVVAAWAQTTAGVKTDRAAADPGRAGVEINRPPSQGGLQGGAAVVVQDEAGISKGAASAGSTLPRPLPEREGGQSGLTASKPGSVSNAPGSGRGTCPDCPPQSIWGQNGHTCDDTWSAATSAVFPGGDPNYVVYESLPQLPCEICDIHWWGLTLQYNNGWFACPAPAGLVYEIKFYADNSGLPGAELCSYTVTPTPVACDLCNDVFPLYYFSAGFMPCCFSFATQQGWVSIQSLEDVSNLCVFLWFSAVCGDASSVQWNGTTMSALAFDRAVCLTGPCAAPGACCAADGSCHPNFTVADCCAAGGVFMGPWVACVPYLCGGLGPVCPDGNPPSEPLTIYGQPAHSCYQNWTVLTSAANVATGFRAFDNFAGATADICDLHWWGLSLRWSGSWQVCDPVGMQFEVRFYPDDNNLPAYGSPVCTYSLTPTITEVDPGGCSGRSQWAFEAALTPCCTLTDGWLSIRSTTSTNDCSFLWFSSAYGDGRSLQQTGTNWPPTVKSHDLGFCLTGVPHTGACMMPDGSCRDGETRYVCEVVYDGAYMGDGTLCENYYPHYCPDDALYGQEPDLGWEDPRAVTSDADLGYMAFDNCAGLAQPVCGIRWWGLSLAWSGGWSLCEPAGMALEIKFYPDNGLNEPDTGSPACTYQVTPPAVVRDLYSTFTVWQWEADLTPGCLIPDPGWLSIQSLSSPNGCAFLWWSGGPADGLCYQWDGTTLAANTFDLSFCLLPRAGCPGDSNCDEIVNWRDIDYFVAAMNDNVAAWEALFSPPGPPCPFANNDVNGDGTVNWRDIDPLVAVMNTSCP